MVDVADPTAQPDPPASRRRIQFKDYGSWRANLLLWGLPLALVVLFLLGFFGSGSVMSIAGIPFDVTCEGWSDDPSHCAQWAEDVVDSGIPESEPLPADVMELELKKSWFGLGDQCTAVFTFDGGATAESEVPCP